MLRALAALFGLTVVEIKKGEGKEDPVALLKQMHTKSWKRGRETQELLSHSKSLGVLFA